MLKTGERTTGGSEFRIDPMRGGNRRRGPGGRRGSSASALAFPADEGPRRWGGKGKAGSNDHDAHTMHVACREKTIGAGAEGARAKPACKAGAKHVVMKK